MTLYFLQHLPGGDESEEAGADETADEVEEQAE